MEIIIHTQQLAYLNKQWLGISIEDILVNGLLWVELAQAE